MTLAAVAVITVVVLPFTRWSSIAGDIASSAAYIVNWRLASQAVDYLASEAAPSPVQHFWSLAVEEQFYIIWPMLVIALAAVGRRRGWTLRRTLFVGITALATLSLAWSMHLTSANPGRAYFVSTTRVWELALGAGLAIIAPRLIRLRPGVATVLGWAGLTAIIFAGTTYDAATPFPGVAALVPTLGAVAVIAAGVRRSVTGVDGLLSVPPMQDIGTLSYSLYLWHWPVLVAATAVWGREDGTLWLPVAVMAVGFSAVPAWFTYRVVEAPIHYGRYFRPLRRAAVLGVTCTVIGLAASIAIVSAVPDTKSEPTLGERPGAAIIETLDDPRDALVDEASVPLDPVAAVEDNANIYGKDCHQDQQSAELLSCSFGNPDAGMVIALVGDSHARQWQPALVDIAVDRGWRLDTYTKSSCGFFTVDVVKADRSPYSSCTEWNTNLREHLTGPGGPDVVIAASSVAQHVLEGGRVLKGEENADRLGDGMRKAWMELENKGVEVVVIRDTPRRPFDTPECVADNPTQLGKCSSDVGDHYLRAIDAKAAKRAEGVAFIDMTPYICPGDVCPGVIGDVIVWRDSNHLTASYVRSLAPFLERALSDSVREPD